MIVPSLKNNLIFQKHLFLFQQAFKQQHFPLHGSAFIALYSINYDMATKFDLI